MYCVPQCRRQGEPGAERMTPGRGAGVKASQCARLLAALEHAPRQNSHPAGPHRWLSVSEIMRLGIAQYSARIVELRRELAPKGFVIVNHKAWNDVEKRYHSEYALMSVEEEKAFRGYEFPAGAAAEDCP